MIDTYRDLPRLAPAGLEDVWTAYRACVKQVGIAKSARPHPTNPFWQHLPPMPLAAKDDDEKMDFACEVCEGRLLKRARRASMKELCTDFGVPTTGNEKELAKILAEQLHAYTDDEGAD